MNMIADFARADTTMMTKMPFRQIADAAEDRPALAWQIDATSGRAVGRWILLADRAKRV